LGLVASRKWRSRSSQTERAARRRRWDVTFRRDTLHDKYWKPLLRRAGLLDERFHDLRHTCATLLLTKEVHPKIVSEKLGHSSIAITLDTHSHVIPGLGEVVASAIGGRAGDGPGDGDRKR
jgi:integrase